MKTRMQSFLAALAATAHAADPKIAQKQQDIRDLAQQTLLRLYKAEPKTKSAGASAAGYAAFSNMGTKLLVAGSGNGKGLAVHNKTKQETFINSGWDFGGQTTAAATTGNKGAAMAGAVSVADDVGMYQLTDKGIALEITAKGTKYYKDSDLN